MTANRGHCAAAELDLFGSAAALFYPGATVANKQKSKHSHDSLESILGKHQEWLASSGSDGSRLMLFNMTIEEIDFSDVVLDQAWFKGVEFRDCIFNRASFKSCDFSPKDGYTNSFFYCIFDYADFSGADFEDVLFDSCTFLSARYTTEMRECHDMNMCMIDRDKIAFFSGCDFFDSLIDGYSYNS